MDAGAAAQSAVVSHIRLLPILDAAAAPQLRDTLLASLDRQRPIVLDGEEVERFSTPCAQVLVAAARMAETLDIAIRLEPASPQLLTAMDDLGVRAALATWMS